MIWVGIRKLVCQAKAGDREAWERLHALVQPFLCRLAGQLLGPGWPDQSAQDLMQGTWIRALKNLATFRGGAGTALRVRAGRTVQEPGHGEEGRAAHQLPQPHRAADGRSGEERHRGHRARGHRAVDARSVLPGRLDGGHDRVRPARPAARRDQVGVAALRGDPAVGGVGEVVGGAERRDCDEARRHDTEQAEALVAVDVNTGKYVGKSNRLHDIEVSDGATKHVDVRPLLDGPVFEPLRDPAYFALMTLDPICGTVVWPNGADFAPEALRAL